MQQRPHPFPYQLTGLTAVWLVASALQTVGCGNAGGGSPATSTDVTGTDVTSGSPTVNATSSSSPSNPSSTSQQPPSTANSQTTNSTSAPTNVMPATSEPAAVTPASSDSERATADESSTSSEVDSSGSSAPQLSSEPNSTEPTAIDLKTYAVGFHELYLHDECTDDNPADDVCAHARVHEVPFVFGGDPAVTYDVKLRIRGLFEPTNVSGGQSPDPAHPYFKINGKVEKADYSQWQIVVAEPANTYYLNHYPEVGHTIYKEDFEATVSLKGGAEVKVRVEDANDRQIDNGYVGNPDRQQQLEGVTDGVVDGQVLRLDVLDVTAR